VDVNFREDLFHALEAKAAPDAMGEAARPERRHGKGSEGGPKDPFPPLGAPYPEQGLVRIGRKGRKRIISRPERRTKRAGTP
jgi:hypothetical protein